MTRLQSLRQYGRLAVGQRVLFERLEAAPGERHVVSGNRVTIRTEHTITGMWHCDSGVIVDLTDDDGAVIDRNFDAYGQMWGGFGGLTVLADAPSQGRLRGLA